MKTFFILLAVTVTVWVGDLSAQVLGILGQNYSWSDTATVNNVGRDSTFSRVWEDVTVWCRGGEGMVKIGAPDTSAWNSRKYIKLADNQTMSFGPSTKLRRMQFRSVTGNVIFYFVGHKKTWQVGTGN